MFPSFPISESKPDSPILSGSSEIHKTVMTQWTHTSLTKHQSTFTMNEQADKVLYD